MIGKTNFEKTNFMLISRKRQPPISINGIPIQQISSFRYLGVILSQDLSWGYHINQMCLRAKKLFGYLYRGFGQATTKCLAYLKVLVLPVLSYCSTVWDPHQRCRIDQVERIQGMRKTKYI